MIAQTWSTPAATTHTRRCWRVDLRLGQTRWQCADATCLHPASGARASDGLVHLAEHAATEPLERHLRTCRCYATGCTWHPRHRGCAGPIVLVLFQLDRGRSWLLADACVGCANVIPNAAHVQRADASDHAEARDGDCRRPHAPRAGTGNSLHNALRYLDAAFNPGIPAAARLLALLCLLRASQDGIAKLPRGLLRSWRLARMGDVLISDLVMLGWLQPAELATSNGPCTDAGRMLQIADPAARMALTGWPRHERRALLNHATRLQAGVSGGQGNGEARLALLWREPALP